MTLTESVTLPTLDSPSKSVCSSEHEIICFLCFNPISNQIKTACCRRVSCLKCVSIWYFHYGCRCPFCNLPKKIDSVEFDEMFHQLSLNPEMFEIVLKAKPSRKIHTQPLFPQNYFRQPERHLTDGTVNPQPPPANQTETPVNDGVIINLNTTSTVLLNQPKKCCADCYLSSLLLIFLMCLSFLTAVILAGITIGLIIIKN